MLRVLQRAGRQVLHRVTVHVYRVVVHGALVVRVEPQVLLVADLAVVLIVDDPQELRLEIREAG